MEALAGGTIGRRARTDAETIRSFVNTPAAAHVVGTGHRRGDLSGGQPKRMQLEDLTRVMLTTWDAQRESVAIGQSV